MQLFEPIRLGALDLRNRIMMTVHGPRLSADRYLRYLDERTRDVALVGVHAIGGVFNFPFEPGGFVASYAADLDGQPPHPLTAEGRDYYDRDIATMTEQAAIVHRNGAMVVGQIFHGGVTVGPSPIDDELARGIPHALTTNEIADFVAACALAARRAVRAGLDGIEVHAAHGYLVNQFLSPATNQRGDDFGGSPERRLRFLLEILGAVRDECGDGFPIGVRIPGVEFVEGGLTVSDVCSIAQSLEQWGVAYVNVSSGNYTGLAQGAAARVRRVVVHTPRSERPVRSGDPRRARPGPGDRGGPDHRSRVRRADPGRRCRRHDRAHPRAHRRPGDHRQGARRPQGCGGHVHRRQRVSLRPDGRVRREPKRRARGRAGDPRAAEHGRRVMVVGGGPAGMECARVAALRGHHVELVESAAVLGGALRIVAADPNRSGFAGFLDGLERRVRDAGVAVTLGEQVTADELAAADADVIVLATGAVEWVPPVPGLAGANVVTALEVLGGAAPQGGHALVIGGRDDHFPPLTTADFLAERVDCVTLLTELPVAGQGIEAANQLMLLRRLLDRGVDVRVLSALHELRGSDVVVRNVVTNGLTTISGIDVVVPACGRRPSTALLDAVDGSARRVQLIGDCFSPRRLVHAMLDGSRFAVTI